MASSINKVILIGNLGNDPEIRKNQAGDKIASFTLATSEAWKDKATGEKKENTQWHKIVVFNKNLADFVEKYLKKGNKVYIEGSLQNRKWTDDKGIERYLTEVVLKNYNGELVILQNKNTLNNESSQPNINQPQNEPFIADELEDDIPF